MEQTGPQSAEALQGVKALAGQHVPANLYLDLLSND